MSLRSINENATAEIQAKLAVETTADLKVVRARLAKRRALVAAGVAAVTLIGRRSPRLALRVSLIGSTFYFVAGGTYVLSQIDKALRSRNTFGGAL